MRRSQPAPQEDPSVKVFRERQIEDLAKIDEEENRRLKMAFRLTRGVRAFRPSAAGGNGSTSGGSGGPSGGRAASRPGRGSRRGEGFRIP